MTDVIRRRVSTMQKPSFGAKIIVSGVYLHIALLRADPSRVFKFCAPDYPETVESSEQEKKILQILGGHRFIINLYWVSDRGLCFEYYPFGSLRSYYGTLHPDLPELDKRIQWC